MSATLSVSPTEIERVYALFAAFWQMLERAHHQSGSLWRAAFETAVVEITTNVLRHAHPTDPPAGAQPAVEVTLRFDQEGAHAEILDNGVAYIPPELPATSPAEIVAERTALSDLPESGMGLSIAASLVDVLHYERTPSQQNRWLLTKRWGSSAT